MNLKDKAVIIIIDSYFNKLKKFIIKIFFKLKFLFQLHHKKTFYDFCTVMR